jgi:TRAP-type C4-dicarboxylate transport system permease small subunit
VSKNPVVIAILTTILFAGTLGVLIAVAGFGMIRVGEEMMEALGILPARWGENNVILLLQLSGVVAVPLVLWFSLWFYRKALAAERILTAQEAEAAQAGPRTVSPS